MKIKRKAAKDWDSKVPELPKHLKDHSKKKKIAKLSAKLNEEMQKNEKKDKKRKIAAFNPDEMGERYEKEQEILKTAETTFNATKAEIMLYAHNASFKMHQGNLTVVWGQLYEVGYLETDPSPKPDVNLVRKHLKMHLQKLLVTPPKIVNEKALEKLVEDGTITPAQLKLVCVKPAPQRRIHVKHL